MHPRELPLMETHRFITHALAGRKRILDVGCGRGLLAAKLGSEGLAVTALDRSLAHLEARGTANVTFIERDFLEYEAEPFEAILFVTSLHHIPDLDRALLRAHELLLPGGLLIAEEFALEAPDAHTARWYYEVQELLALGGLHPHEHHQHIHGSSAQSPQARWMNEHVETPPLHSGEAMATPVKKRFRILETTPGPFLYRHICHGLEATDRGGSLAQYIFDAEKRRIAEGTLRPVGLRLLAQKL
jgi:SAM-dependent methyltransferase